MPINKYLYRTLALPGTISLVLKNIHVQKKFLAQYIDPILKNTLAANDGSIDDHDIRKINTYYGLAVPAILGEAFCILRGTNMTARERLASTAQGAMTGLFDDFFDKDYLSDNAVENIIHQQSNSGNKKANQVLFDIFYKMALDNVPDKKLLVDALLDVYRAQVSSKLQLNHAIPYEELLNITMHKGGSSVLFYRTAFFPEVSGKEKNLINNLGAMMQLGNDIFDVYKDRESGINTLVTLNSHIDEIRTLLKTRLREYYSAAHELGYPEKNTRTFLNLLSIAIFSRCFVCLDQLESNEKLTGNQFTVSAYSRKQLICDMDKKINMLRSAKKHICEMP